MVRRHLRTRSEKKVKVKTPGGVTVTHFKSQKPSKASCGRCKGMLGGVPSGKQRRMRALKPSERTPSRPYAGVLCEKCTDELVRYVTRLEVKYSDPAYGGLDLQRDLTIEKYLPTGWHTDVSKGALKLEKTPETGGEPEKQAVKKKLSAKKTKA
jgi:large subunit ribosomal protein L34e